MENNFRYRQFLYVSKAVSLPPNNERKSQTKSTVCPFLSPPLPLFCHPFAQLLNFFTYSPNKYCTNSRQYPWKTYHTLYSVLLFPHAASHRTHLTFCDCDACMYLKVTHFCHNLVWLIINDKEKVVLKVNARVIRDCRIVSKVWYIFYNVGHNFFRTKMKAMLATIRKMI